MSALTTYLEQQQAHHAAKQKDVDALLAEQTRGLQREHASRMEQLDRAHERRLALLEPLLPGLSALPDDVTIQAIEQHQQNIAIRLNVSEGASIASLVLDYPPLPFQLLADGSMKEPSDDSSKEMVYSGLLLSSKHLHWEAMVEGTVVNFQCETPGVSVQAWKNPSHTGSPVATVAVGDLSTTTPWRSIGFEGADYWAQPSKGLAMDAMEPAKAWLQETMHQQTLKAQFHAMMASEPKLTQGRGVLLLNAMYQLAVGDTSLPVVDDFKAWAAPTSNVRVLHNVKDLETLLDEKGPAFASNSAQEKLQQISRHLPNIWTLTDEKGLALLCTAMQTVRGQMGARPSNSEQPPGV